MKNFSFMSKKDLNKIIDTRDLEMWNKIYTEHMQMWENSKVKNTFYYIVVALYKELNSYVKKALTLDTNSFEYMQLMHHRAVSVKPICLNEVRTMFIKQKTKQSLATEFTQLGYTFLDSNFFGVGDSISIHF